MAFQIRMTSFFFKMAFNVFGGKYEVFFEYLGILKFFSKMVGIPIK